MQIYDHIPDEFADDVALCIGKFDGFHRGHRLLLEEAKRTDCPVTVLTFVFNRTETIDSASEKRRIAESLGVDYYVEIHAGTDFFSLTPEAFIGDVVKNKLHARHVIVGEDFRFGHERAGDIKTLQSMSETYDYELHVIPKMQDDGTDISSSRIRACIAAGRMDETERLLGRNYRIEGTVSGGNHIGRRMGVPTANLVPDPDKVLPPRGVYAVRVRIDGDDAEYGGIGNLGVKPTVGPDNPVGFEVHLFDTEENLYNRTLSVSILTFLREERQFQSMEELNRKIESDIEDAKRRLEI